MKTPTLPLLLAALLAALLATGSAHAALSAYSWTENGVTRHAWLDDGVRAEVGAARASGLSIVQQEHNVRFYRTDSARSRSLAKQQTGLLPVLRQGNSSDAPWLLPAGGVIVQTRDQAALQAWVAQRGLTLRQSPVQGFWIVDSAAGEAALQLASALQTLPGIVTAAPNWSSPRAKR